MKRPALKSAEANAGAERLPCQIRIRWGPGLVSMRATWGPGLVSARVTWGPGLVSMRVRWGPGLVGPISGWDLLVLDVHMHMHMHMHLVGPISGWDLLVLDGRRQRRRRRILAVEECGVLALGKMHGQPSATEPFFERLLGLADGGLRRGLSQ